LINQLIKALYDPKFNLPNDIHFYDQLIEEIEYYSISAQVYYLLKKQGGLENTPLSFQMRLKKIYQVVLYQNMFIKSQTEQLLKKFEMMGLEVMPIKGVYFAEKYYGHIGARGTSDIDILIRKKDMDKAIGIVKSMGFDIEEVAFPDHFHSSFSKITPGSPVYITVEIHWNILKETTSNFKVGELWDEAVKLEEYQHVKTLSEYHTFYMMCLHGWRHNLDSPKHFLDIIQMIHMLNDRLNYEDLLRDAKAHQTLKRIKRTLSIVYKEYPMLDRINEFPQKKINRYWNGHGTTSKKNKGLNQYVDFIDYQFLSYDSAKHSLIEVSHWLLPSPLEIVSQLNRYDKQRSYFFQLINLYKQRCTSAAKSLFNNDL
jgi:hypothetical protein